MACNFLAFSGETAHYTFALRSAMTTYVKLQPQLTPVMALPLSYTGHVLHAKRWKSLRPAAKREFQCGQKARSKRRHFEKKTQEQGDRNTNRVGLKTLFKTLSSNQGLGRIPTEAGVWGHIGEKMVDVVALAFRSLQTAQPKNQQNQLKKLIFGGPQPKNQQNQFQKFGISFFVRFKIVLDFWCVFVLASAPQILRVQRGHPWKKHLHWAKSGRCKIYGEVPVKY